MYTDFIRKERIGCGRKSGKAFSNVVNVIHATKEDRKNRSVGENMLVEKKRIGWGRNQTLTLSKVFKVIHATKEHRGSRSVGENMLYTKEKDWV